jgi:hypothetical protein
MPVMPPKRASAGVMMMFPSGNLTNALSGTQGEGGMGAEGFEPPASSV